MQRGYTLTNAGYELIARSIASSVPIVWTGVTMGERAAPDDTDMMAMIELNDPIVAGTSTAPVYNGDRISMTVEYRSDLNGGYSRAVNIAEFGVFAKLMTEDDTVLFIYASLGDYPTQVGTPDDGYNDIRRWPISIHVGKGLSFETGYVPLGFMTAAEITEFCKTTLLPEVTQHIREKLPGILYESVDVPLTAWTTNDLGAFAALQISWAAANMIPLAIVETGSLPAACRCGLRMAASMDNGVLHLQARTIPDAVISIDVLGLQPNGTAIDGQIISGITTIPTATRNSLGAVRIGTGIGITPDGTISVDSTALLNDIAATDAEVDQMIDGVLSEDE